MIHTSIGLIPEFPHCHRHPGAKMKLRPADVPIFQHCNEAIKARNRFTRKIYRCSVKDCPVVWNGPTAGAFTAGQREHQNIKRYREAR